MARITRKELKTDKFALEVEQTVTFFEDHQQELLRYGGVALVVILLLVGYMFYSRHQQAQREIALYQAIQVEEAPVGPPTPGANTNFPTQEAKDQVAVKAFSDILSAYPHSTEGEIPQYYLGSIYADQGKMADAEKYFKQVADNGGDQYASLAKLSLAEIYFADGRAAQGEAMLRGLMEHPTVFVSKDQAAIALARYLAPKNPAEARKLIAPLRPVPGPVGQAAMEIDYRAAGAITRNRDAWPAAVSGGAKPGAALPRAGPPLPQLLPARPRPRGPFPRVPPSGGQDPGLHARAFRPFPQPPDPYHRGGADCPHRGRRAAIWTRILPKPWRWPTTSATHPSPMPARRSSTGRCGLRRTLRPQPARPAHRGTVRAALCPLPRPEPHLRSARGHRQTFARFRARRESRGGSLSARSAPAARSAVDRPGRRGRLQHRRPGRRLLRRCSGCARKSPPPCRNMPPSPRPPAPVSGRHRRASVSTNACAN